MSGDWGAAGRWCMEGGRRARRSGSPCPTLRSMAIRWAASLQPGPDSRCVQLVPAVSSKPVCSGRVLKATTSQILEDAPRTHPVVKSGPCPQAPSPGLPSSEPCSASWPVPPHACASSSWGDGTPPHACASSSWSSNFLAPDAIKEAVQSLPPPPSHKEAVLVLPPPPTWISAPTGSGAWRSGV